MAEDEQPTQIQPTAPTPPGADGVTAVEPREPVPSAGGPGGGVPPIPPVGTGGGGGGNGGWDDDSEDPEADARKRRNALIITGAAVLIVIAGLLAWGISGNKDAEVAPNPVPTETVGSTTSAAPATTPQATPAPEPTETTPAATGPADSGGNSGGVSAGGDTETPSADSGPLLTESAGTQKLSFTQGETVRFRVESADDNELHIHGYDITKKLPAGETVNVSFKATLTGIFEVELHEGSGAKLADLTIEP